ncbi:hypothetical protein EDS67_03375 [candidate division KSB1 bacterium]|nr:MAG: hypothetical protein EDS67_03375 [candidate division KSB1 bacterium]MBC6952321.1 hypothetical protein [candidate division KSB1 bacterium]MCE7939967.1 hypothetical protein [Chlorobi bacterium CHB1]
MILPVAIIVLAVLYLGYDLVKPMLTSPCESIFQQTAVSLKSDLEIVESKGALFIGREKIQDLAERAQMAALNLKTCCILSESGKLNAEEFLECKGDVERYQRQMENIAQQVDAAQQARQAGDEALAAQKMKAINQILANLESSAQKIEHHAQQLQVAQQTAKIDAEGQKSSGEKEGTGAKTAVKAGRINLLAAENGGQVLVASSDAWIRAIDGDEKKFSFDYKMTPEAVLAFRDERLATFDTFCMLIVETSRDNIAEFELFTGNESSTGAFESIGKFKTHNANLVKTPYQEFTFPAVTAKYLKVCVLSAHGKSKIPYAREFQLWGRLK